AIDLRLPFRVISDPDCDVIKAYGVYDDSTDTADPTVFLIDKNGVVRFRKTIESLYDRVPADEIVNRLRDLGTPRGEKPFQSFR
ncbi:MAG TPA: redoxin domain-containing protein, partial [Methanocella sp.]|nr:redoxin domain-containing protein [Methanocella sp.]